ncbi:hypothetical protein DENIS_4087 [Desulfonema ishimotonii]|uniref:Uncharacterized protein n=1 Tax=Desulfonema ishimotonii TaxID=45657 RepID=A0A401G1I4_9BACT|nr:TMEM43 family protein [Desulfonema ishimotonii]GBC63098.1 hypothetical protein DENIS_4087 [Desulfonema ishimotonii]
MTDELFEEEGAETPKRPEDEDSPPEEEVFEETEEEGIVEEESDVVEEIFEEDAADEAVSDETFEAEEPESYLEEDAAESDTVFEEAAGDDFSEEYYEEAAGGDTYAEDVGEDETSYAEESEQSWGDRLGSAVKGVLIGGIIFLAGFPLLFWNEGRAVRQYKNLKEGAGSVISVSADKIDPANNGKLVHVTGLATANEVLTDGDRNDTGPVVSISPDRADPVNNGRQVHVTGGATTQAKISEPDFGFAVNAIMLERVVRMCQWREVIGPATTEKKLGGKKVTTRKISYKKVWADERIDSEQFRGKQKARYANPASMTWPGKTFDPAPVTLGAFTLDERFVREISAFRKLKFKKLPAGLPDGLKGKIQLYDGGLFLGKDPRKPQIGDLRIEYRAVGINAAQKPVPISLMAKQDGSRLVPEIAPDGKILSRLVLGTQQIEEMVMPSGITVKDAITLKRSVQMYQWAEKQETKTVRQSDGKEKKVQVWSYEKIWSASLIDSDRFRQKSSHANPQQMACEGKTITARKVMLGAFELPRNYVSRLNRFEPLPVESLSEAVPEELREKTKVVSGGYYIGKDPQKPAVGDMKVSYSVVRPQTVTVVAEQAGQSFAPFATEHGTIEEFVMGKQTAESLFTAARQQNKIISWLLRLAGFAAMFIGLSMVLKPISVAFDVIPFLGNIAGIGTGLISGLMAAGFSLMTIALAWIFYRPLFGILLIAAGVGLIFGVKMLRGKKGRVAPRALPPSGPPAAPPPPPPGQ